MQLDSNIYFKQRQGPNLASNMQQGFTLGQMIKKNRLADKERENQQKLKSMIAENISYDDKGNMSASGETIGQLARLDPNTANKYASQLSGQATKQSQAETAASRYADTRSDRAADVAFRDKKLKEDSLFKREKADFDARKAERDGLSENFVPDMGVAYTKDDAKKLKDSKEMKSKFDRELGEMIQLRKDYGGEVANREAVARGQQLSKKLLLTYKNLAKLGVLSKSDEDIVNAIIPSDPLQFDLSSLVGQDPTLHTLEKFKGDLDADYSETLRTRIKTPVEGAYASSGLQKKIKFNQKTGAPLVNQKVAQQLTDEELDELINKEAARQGTANAR